MRGTLTRQEDTSEKNEPSDDERAGRCRSSYRLGACRAVVRAKRQQPAVVATWASEATSEGPEVWSAPAAKCNAVRCTQDGGGRGDADSTGRAGCGRFSLMKRHFGSLDCLEPDRFSSTSLPPARVSGFSFSEMISRGELRIHQVRRIWFTGDGGRISGRRVRTRESWPHGPSPPSHQ